MKIFKMALVAIFATASIFYPLGISQSFAEVEDQSIQQAGDSSLHSNSSFSISDTESGSRFPGEPSNTNNEWNQQALTKSMKGYYSYGWWLSASSQVPGMFGKVINANGFGGNYIIVCPENDLVVSVSNYNTNGTNPSLGAYFKAVIRSIDGTDLYQEDEKYKFKDVAYSHWGMKYIDELSRKGIIKGWPDGEFRPDRTLTRAEFATLLARALGLNLKSYKGTFKDVKEGRWYALPVEAAARKGIIRAGNKNFYPNAPIKREEMAAMIMEAYSVISGLEIGSLADGVKLKFKDKDQISSSALKSVKAAYFMDFLHGRPGGRFEPKAYSTRAEAAKVIDMLSESVS